MHMSFLLMYGCCHAAGVVQGVEGVGVVEEEGGVVCDRHAGDGEAVLVVVATEEGADWHDGRQGWAETGRARRELKGTEISLWGNI